MTKEILLALGGGGVKGNAHIGVLRVLEQAGYTIAGMAGTSATTGFGALCLPTDIHRMRSSGWFLSWI